MAESISLPIDYLARMQGLLGDAFADYLSAMAQKPRRALRVNTLKTTADALMKRCDFPLTPTDISALCFLIPDDAVVGRHPLHAAGLFYLQEPSAQLPVSYLDVGRDMAVLDLCAAPGGKASQIAALMENTGILVANEPVRGRADALRFNLERLGVTNALVTNMQPEPLCRALNETFDAVLVDAPCAGEGMFRKEPAAVAAWSQEHVRACALRQRGILDCAATALRKGGTLVYSTCSFSAEENEETVAAFLSAHSEFALIEQHRWYPHTSVGEGQFMAKLCKAGVGTARIAPPKRTRVSCWETFCEQYLVRPPDRAALSLPDGRVRLLPERMPLGTDGLHILGAGIAALEQKKGAAVPDHALFMALKKEDVRQTVTLSGAALTAFLAGETVPCDGKLAGWCAVCAGDDPVGFGKAVGGTLKNHLPKGLRLR